MKQREGERRFHLRELASLHASLRGLFVLALGLTLALFAYIFARLSLVGWTLSTVEFASMCLFTFAAVLLCNVQLRCLHQLRCETRRDVERLTFVDALSGAYNFRYLRQRLGEELRRAARLGEPLSVAYLDFDHFKEVNDTFGHEEGNAVLEKIGGALRAGVRGEDFVGRLGGDEFVVVLPQTGREGAFRAAERIKDSLDCYRLVTSRGCPIRPLSFSIGVATFPDDAATAEDLLAQADRALYAAKRAGGDRIVGAADALCDSDGPAAILLDVSACAPPGPTQREAGIRGG